ncbi:MAG: hypothetical protein J6333_08965 [Planctomycetes bacterium]|nr:hypothetical protein [Planctomycetota bacterium]
MMKSLRNLSFVLLLGIAASAVAAADEADDFYACLDAEERTAAAKDDGEEDWSPAKDPVVQRELRYLLQDPKRPLTEALTTVVTAEDTGFGQKLAVIRGFQKSRAFTDKDVREALHEILRNAHGIKKEPPYSACGQGTFDYYTILLPYFGDASTLEMLGGIIDQKVEELERKNLKRLKLAPEERKLADRNWFFIKHAARAYIILNHGTVDRRLWRFFVSGYWRDNNVCESMARSVRDFCFASDLTEAEREQFRESLLRLYHLSGRSADIVPLLLSIRCRSLQFLRLHKQDLVVRARLGKSRDSIIELKRPCWGKITLEEPFDEQFQEVLRQEVPPSSPPTNRPPKGWMGPATFPPEKAPATPQKWK